MTGATLHRVRKSLAKKGDIFTEIRVKRSGQPCADLREVQAEGIAKTLKAAIWRTLEPGARKKDWGLSGSGGALKST